MKEFSDSYRFLHDSEIEELAKFAITKQLKKGEYFIREGVCDLSIINSLCLFSCFSSLSQCFFEVLSVTSWGVIPIRK